MHSKFKFVLACSVLCVLWFLWGCQESERSGEAGSRDVMRRAQLVGNENIQLKRQVAELEKQVAELKVKLDEEHKTRLANQKQMGEGYMKLMEMLTDCRKRLREYEPARGQ